MKTNFDNFQNDAERASNFLKAISSKNRLMILCKLAESEKSVNELLEFIDISQSALSQNLIRMKQEGILSSRSEGTQNIYFISNNIVKDLFKILYKNFCGAKNDN